MTYMQRIQHNNIEQRASHSSASHQGATYQQQATNIDSHAALAVLAALAALAALFLWRHSTFGSHSGSWLEIWVRGTKAFQYFLGCSTWLHFIFFYYFFFLFLARKDYIL